MSELEIDCGEFGKIRRMTPPSEGDWAIKDGRLTLLGCIVRGLVTLSREELLPFLDAMDAQDAQIRTLNERIIELDLEAMEKCRRIDSLLTPPPDAAVEEAVELWAEARCSRLARGILRIGKKLRAMRADMASQTDALIAAMHAINDAGILMPDEVFNFVSTKRAVQSPRLTPEQMEAVKIVETLLTDTMSDYGDCEHDVGHCICKYRSGVFSLRSAFPDLFTGEVGRGEA